MGEPKQLKFGKRFHKKVQLNFEQFSEGNPQRETYLKLPSNFKTKSGRMDILITEMDDNVAILEIKGTNWDRIKQNNVKRNLYNHQRQLFKYIDTYMEEHKELTVTHGVIYPFPPNEKNLRSFIEDYMMTKYSVPIFFYSEIKSE